MRAGGPSPRFDYVPASSSGTGLQLDIGARLTLIYLPFVQ